MSKKVIIGAFAHESNFFCPNLTTQEKFRFAEGPEVIELLPVKDIFEEAGYTIIPTIFASAESLGPVDRKAFDFFESRILEVVRQHPDADGVWMFCHGAMTVDGMDVAGEYHLMKNIRAIVGENCQISLGMDLHGNIEADFSDVVNIFRCYHTAPHTDQTDTYRRTAKALVKTLERGESTHTEMVKVPMIFPGEMAATTTEPFKSIITELKRMENEDDKIECASMYIGFAWADAKRTGATVAVVPAAAEHQEYCKAEAKRIADLAFSKRREFKFEMESYPPAEAIEHALASDIVPVCVTDMGDNPTAGTNGGSLSLLNEVLRQNKGDEVLVAGIYDAKAVAVCEQSVGQSIELTIGIDIDEITRPITLWVEVKDVFDVYDWDIDTNPATVRGRGAMIRCGTTDIVLTDFPFAFIHTETFEKSPIDVNKYKVVVTKFGYIYPDLKKFTNRYIMSNTPGESYQIVTELTYHNLNHPVFPFDDI